MADRAVRLAQLDRKYTRNFSFTNTRRKVLASILDRNDVRATSAAKSSGIKPSTYISIRNALKAGGILTTEIIPSPIFFGRSVVGVIELHIRPRASSNELTHMLLRSAAEVPGIVTIISSALKILVIGLYSTLAEAQEARDRFVMSVDRDVLAHRHERQLLADLRSPGTLMLEDYFYTAARVAGFRHSPAHHPLSIKFGQDRDATEGEDEVRRLLMFLISNPERSDSSIAGHSGFSRDTVARYRKMIASENMARTAYFLNPETVGAGILSVSSFRLARQMTQDVAGELMRDGNLSFLLSSGNRLIVMSYCRTIADSEETIAAVLNHPGASAEIDPDLCNSLYSLEDSPFLMRHAYWRLLEEGSSQRASAGVSYERSQAPRL